MKKVDFYKSANDMPVVKKKRKKSYGRFIFRTALSVILLAAVGYGVYLAAIYYQGKSFLENIHNSTSASDNSAIEEETVNIDAKDLSINTNLPKTWTNILLLGGDSRTKKSHGLSDSMIIASINKDTGEIKLTSLMRDTWVSIPQKGDNKLNAANAFGGPKLAMKTINENFDMNISKYVFIDFFGFPYVVDKIGGVNLEVKKFEVRYVNLYINDLPKSKYPKGTNFSLLKTYGVDTHLTGIQALGYARIRHADSDFVRTQRQRNVLFAMLKKVKAQGKSFNLLSTAAAVLPMVETNLSTSEIASLGGKVLKSNVDEFKELRLPADKYYEDASINGMSVLKADMPKNKELLYNFIYGQ